MSWLFHFHRCLVLCGVSLLVIKGCRCFFLRHTRSGKCIAAEKASYWSNKWGHRYWAVLSDCLNVSAQLQYWPNSEAVHNMARNGTLVLLDGDRYEQRLLIYDAITNPNYERDVRHSMKQRDAGPLFFYNGKTDSCAQPDTSQKYIMRKKNGCDDTEEQQKFTFGSVTQFGDKMKDVHCSPKQRMVIHKAHYGDFNKSGTFDVNATLDAQCSGQASCEVKSLCAGKRSCELTVDNNLLSSHYCSDTVKELFIEYTCVDNYFINPMTTASNIRLSKSPNEGFIEVKNYTTWRKVIEENWDKNRQKMLCEHLGFSETGANTIRNMEIAANEEIASGDLMCYNTGSSGTSCCVDLVPSTTTSNVNISYAKCKICDKPALLQDESTFADSVFSGSGSSGYSNARFTKDGWCTQTPQTHYLLIDLLKDYHITRVVTMGNKDQTKWSDQYTMTYSHGDSFSNSRQVIIGNQNGYQASRTAFNIYNVRHVKIQSTGTNDFCLRIELCGEVQTPTPVQVIKVTPSNTSADVTWKIPEPKDSSYITNYNIFINGKLQHRISREKYDNKFTIRGLKPYTDYKVEIETEDGSGEKGGKVSEDFKTKEGVPSGPPMNVTFTFRSKYSLQLSWMPPESNLHHGVLTGYQVCYSSLTMSTSPKCVKPITTLTLTIDDLQPSTRYFVTVAAGTSAGFGTKSAEINKTTNGVPSGPPLNVTFISRSKSSLGISWKAPVESTRKSKLTGYRVCFSTNDTSPECLIFKSPKVLSLTLNNLRPSTKYFVTVSASTEHGYGEKSLEVSKITNKGPVVNLIATSFYTMTVNIPKQQEYIKEVMVIVQSSANDQVSSEDIKTSDLKNFQSNTRDPYITAYLKADVLPLMFVIGDGKSYNSEEENYHNQPLTANSNYVVFLRFFDSQDSYYSTEWSNSIYTMAKHSELENADNCIRFLIPIIILALCFLLSLGVNIYQRRLNRKNEFDGNKEPKIGNKYVNEGNTVYETPDDVIEEIERNEGARGMAKGQESSDYMSLKDKREPANVYQALQPDGTNDGQSHSKVGGQNSVEYQNPVFSADPNAA